MSPKQPSTVTKVPLNNSTQPIQQQPQQPQQPPNNKVVKSKTKKEEESVKKLFEQNPTKTDDFSQWCCKALDGITSTVDSK